MADHRDLKSRAEFLNACCDLAGSARLNLDILTYAFERELYGHGDFVQAVQALATRHKKARIRILIHSPDWASRSGHRLVELSRRLSSYIQLLGLHEQDQQLTSEVLIADGRSLILRESPDVVEARYYTEDARQAGLWLRRFEGLWAGGEPIPGLRQLNT